MKVLLVLVAIGLLIYGGSSLWVAIKNPRPVTYSIADYNAQRPKDKWLVLEDCRLDVTRSVFRSTSNSNRVPPEEVYIPIMPVGAAPTDPIVALLATTDYETRKLVQDMGKAYDLGSGEPFFRRNQARLVVDRDLRGLAGRSSSSGGLDREELLSIQHHLVDDFVVIQEGKSPSWFAALAIPAGLLLGWLAIFKIGNHRPQHPRQTPPTIPAS